MKFQAEDQGLNAVAALADPVRKAVYEFVRTSEAAVGRDECASALDLPRNTVAFQLDKLADQGLLSVEFRRLNGKGGPGSGRPAKLYAATQIDVSASIPHREYALAANIMASAIERAGKQNRPVAPVLAEVAREAGQSIGAHASSLTQALTDHGYRPEVREDGSVGLLDCPFHQLSGSHRATVCTMNFELLTAAVDGANAPYRACFDPPTNEHHCCVRLDPHES
ncbi:helix-turn-helix domain-containing protein [Paeniglutamicibacter psychrophenolicus]|uniref:ArsR family transcriptional regulator n=1 Tax=Paeniglutamicibacter psychrophenolicus TaxID=257454 RepID=A0ABS4WBR7_9MICC|nr:helix-turn-helix domain-containing protein [Paeniglutamicibacter psychrophenolicus]MBP2373650.1 putative ArsR family transcriptional regulator [Paeniglutamicibacter psychrophenolicus]